MSLSDGSSNGLLSAGGGRGSSAARGSPSSRLRLPIVGVSVDSVGLATGGVASVAATVSGSSSSLSIDMSLGVRPPAIGEPWVG